jgi:hypothetical protein
LAALVDYHQTWALVDTALRPSKITLIFFLGVGLWRREGSIVWDRSREGWSPAMRRGRRWNKVDDLGCGRCQKLLMDCILSGKKKY